MHSGIRFPNSSIGRLGWGGPVVCLLVLAVVTEVAGQVSLDEPGLSTGDIVRGEVSPRLRAWKKQFHALQVRYRQVQVDERGEPVDQKVAYAEWRYSRSHQSWYHRWVEDRGGVVSRLLEIVNRERSDVVLYSEGESQLSRPLSVRALQVPSHRTAGILPMRGLWFGDRDQWLPDVLMETHLHTLEWDTVEGHRCLVLPISARGIGAGHWSLDPAVHYLPRRYRDAGETFVVTEFREVSSGVVMPWSGRWELRGEQGDQPVTRYRWDVESMELDPEFDDDAFRVPSENFLGTLIDGLGAEASPAQSDGGAANGDRWWTGPARWLSWGGVAAVVVFAVVGTRAVRRRRKRMQAAGESPNI